MANTTVSYQILKSLLTAVSGTGIKSYLGRPDNVGEKMQDFCVVELVSPIRRPEAGYDDYRYVTSGVIVLYTRSKSDRTPNIDRHTTNLRKLAKVFPYSDEYIEAVKPVVSLGGDDGFGFYSSAITFRIRTKINKFND